MTVQELYSNIDGNYDGAKRILQMDKLIGKFILKFKDDKSCDRLLTGWESGDAGSIFEGAHALKGVCANLGLDRLSQAASAIAEEYRHGEPKMDRAEQEKLIEEIRVLHEKAVAGIKEYEASL